MLFDCIWLSFFLIEVNIFPGNRCRSRDSRNRHFEFSGLLLTLQVLINSDTRNSPVMNITTRSSVRLVNLVFYAHHGVLKEEHAVGAKYEVDAELVFDFTEAAILDDISKTIDYGDVYGKIKTVITQKRYYLIEAVARDIVQELLSDFPILRETTIKVRKRNPPLNGICDYAEACFSAARS